MEEKQIKEEIDKAVKIFRETLEKTYLKPNKEFYGIGVVGMLGNLSGKCNFRRTAKGHLHLSGELHKDAINEKCEGLPRNFNDFDIYPLCINLMNKKFD